MSVFITFDSTREQEGEFSWASSARALKTLSRLRLMTPIAYPTSDRKYKKDVFYFSTHVTITTVTSSHIQKLPSLGVAGKIP